MKWLFFLVVVIVLDNTFSAKLASSFLKCNRNQNDFNECLRTAVENGILLLTTNTANEFGLSLNPLLISSLYVGTGSGAAQFNQNYTDIQTLGYEKTKCAKALLDFEKKTFELDCSIPKLSIEANINLSGKISVLPIAASGHGFVILDHVRIPLKMTLEEYEKKNRKHYRVSKYELILEIKGITFKFDDLFGDKEASERMIKVLNDNSLELYKEIHESYDKCFGDVYTAIFNRIASKIPIEDLFGN